MGQPYPKETPNVKCTIQGCPGDYEDRRIVHTIRHRGRLVVIDHVPAEVCSVCGDVLISPRTARHIEALLETPHRPQRSAPVYEYA